MRHRANLFLLVAIFSLSRAATSSEWAARTIYQVLTDRFASPTNDPCPFVPPFSLPLNVYCGGTWAALTSRLDYIQGMGFDAIWISPIVDQIQFDFDAGYQGVIQSCVVRNADHHVSFTWHLIFTTLVLFQVSWFLDEEIVRTECSLWNAARPSRSDKCSARTWHVGYGGCCR
jgi:hypothetical protein